MQHWNNRYNADDSKHFSKEPKAARRPVCAAKRCLQFKHKTVYNSVCTTVENSYKCQGSNALYYIEAFISFLPLPTSHTSRLHRKGFMEYGAWSENWSSESEDRGNEAREECEQDKVSLKRSRLNIPAKRLQWSLCFNRRRHSVPGTCSHHREGVIDRIRYNSLTPSVDSAISVTASVL